MGCKDCPPSAGTDWLECAACETQYQPYEGMFHSLLCPPCGQRRMELRRARAAKMSKSVRGSFKTGEVTHGRQ